MTLSRRAWLAAALLPMAARSQPLREVHGAHDAWAEAGLALAWGVLRGRDESSTRVVIRIEADPQRHATLAALGRDPFGGGSVELPVQRPADGVWRIELPRSHFADHPRTELRFASAPPGAALLVFYQGVPDTTPESSTPAQLDESQRSRIERARRTLR